VQDLPLIMEKSLAESASIPKRGVPADRSLEEVEKAAVLNALEASEGNKSEAARRLGITRKTLLAKLRKYGAEKENLS
jgi:two-component system response regulator HydG